MLHCDCDRISLPAFDDLGLDIDRDGSQPDAFRRPRDGRLVGIDRSHPRSFPSGVPHLDVVAGDHAHLDDDGENDRDDRQAQRELDRCLPAFVGAHP